MHGYTHVDYGQLSPDEVLHQLNLARQIFNEAGISPAGFRSPYLSRSTDLVNLIETAGFSYVSNQPVLWDALDPGELSAAGRASYARAAAFYRPISAAERPALPWLKHELVEIPVSLPDDEILVDRLGGSSSFIEKVWLGILSRSYELGELFTLQLHPERISRCAAALSAVLAEARRLSPAVWCANLAEIAAWWKARQGTNLRSSPAENGGIQCVVDGPAGTTILARGVEVDGPCRAWSGGYRQVQAASFTIHSRVRPFIGLAAGSAPLLADWLGQQGYLVEFSPERELYASYFDQPEFRPEEERLILAQIENPNLPLVKLGRWPDGARSALAITGDIDALTLWDYGLRLIGK